MRTAHRGVPIASLPVDAGPRLFSGLFGEPRQRSNEGAPAPPPASIQPASTGAASQRDLNDWLIKGLFGRR
jgi:hypothetical protein